MGTVNLTGSLPLGICDKRSRMTRRGAFIAGVLLVVTSRAALAEDTNLPAMEVAQAVMVTAELDFSNKPPAIAQALLEIERVG